MMTKDDAVNEMLRKIYCCTECIVLSKKEIKKIEQYYIKNSAKCSNVREFMDLDKEIGAMINKLKSGKDEIDKQLQSSKALQPAILAECVFVQTLAKILGLKNYLDLERTHFSDVPIEIGPYVKSKSNTICAARYIYYNKNDYNTLIIQYGNPKAGDAATILYTHEILIEIKDMPALLMDTDLIYDEKGKLEIPSKLKEEYPEYAKYIEKFNEKTSIIKHLGSNYKIFGDTHEDCARGDLLKAFFDASNIDVILTTVGKKDELIAIKTKDINYIFPDGTPLIHTSGSEIRPTGKNARAEVFTPKYLENVLNEKDVFVNEDGVCRVYCDNKKVIGKIHGRGKDKDVFTRLKINNVFFVKMEHVSEFNEFDEFPKSKIMQSKSGIALHMEIKKTKIDIKEHLYNW